MFSTFHNIFETNRHRLPLFIPVAVGVGTAWYFQLLNEPNLLPYIAAVGLFAGVAFAVRRRVPLLYGCIILAAGCVGFVNAGWQTHRLHAPILQEPLFWKQVSGHVEAIELDEGSIKITLINPLIETLEPVQTPKKIRISLKEKPLEPLEVGDDISIKATLFPLPEPVAPAAFDFGQYLYFQGLGAVGFSTKQPEITKHSATTSNLIDQFRFDFANDVIAKMAAPYGALSAAVTVGEQKAVPEEVNEVLRDSGLYHILSISGLHMAIAAGLVFMVIRFLLALSPRIALHYPVKKIAAALALFASFLYLLAAGAPVPAIRSFIMVGVVFVAILCDRKGISMVSLGWAALLILLFQPSAVTSASFQLSFAATAAIIALYETYGSVLYRPNAGWIRKLFIAVLATVIVSLVATLATSPFVITHFNRVQLWGLVANAAMSPLTALVIMPSVVLSFLLWPFGLQWLAYVPLEYGMKAMLWIGSQVAHIPFASVFVPSLTMWGFGLACAGLCWLFMMTGNIRKLGLAAIVLGFSSVAMQTSPDVLMSEKGKLIAVKDAKGHVIMLKGGNQSFTSEQWAKSNGQEATLAFEDAVWSADINAKCDKQSCTYTHSGFKSLLVFNPRMTSELCEATKPHLLITRFELYDDECAEVQMLIDREVLEHSGAIDLRFVDGLPVMRQAKILQGKRPWVTNPTP